MQRQSIAALVRMPRVMEMISLKDFSRGFAGMSKDVITGLNITKGGADPPLKPDEEYPEWLWSLAQPERTLGELRRADKSSLGFEDIQRLQKLVNRDRIRTKNQGKAK